MEGNKKNNSRFVGLGLLAAAVGAALAGVYYLITKEEPRQQSTSTCKYPQETYAAGYDTKSGESSSETQDCVICQYPLNTHPVTALECMHSFHSHCINPWLMEHHLCPVCRTSV